MQSSLTAVAQSQTNGRNELRMRVLPERLRIIVEDVRTDGSRHHFLITRWTVRRMDSELSCDMRR